MVEWLTATILALFGHVLRPEPIPQTPHPDWTITQDWTVTNGLPTLTARSETLWKTCSQGSGDYLVLPMIIHSAQEIKINGRPAFQWNDPEFKTVETIYGIPYLRCHLIPENGIVDWHVTSYSSYFSWFNSWPQVSPHPPYANFFERTLHTFAAGAMLALCLIVLIVLRGKVASRSAAFLGGACAALSIYLLAMDSGSFGFAVGMHRVQQVADICLWVGISLIFAYLGSENIFNRALHSGFHILTAVGITIIFLAENGDQIQTGTMIPFSYAPVLLGNALYRSGRACLASKLHRRDVLIFSQVTIFSAASANDMALVTGAIDSVHLLPIGLFAVLFIAIVSIEQQLALTYRERDYLRQNLEIEVAAKTRSLEDTLNRLTQAQNEIIQSSKLAGLGTLAAGIAHEINNSLNYVNGALMPLAKLIERNIPEPEVQAKANRLIEVMRTGISLTAKIIVNLKSYARNGGNNETCNVREIIDGALSLMMSKFEGRVKTIMELEPDLLIHADRVSLTQVFMNLIDNAVDATVESTVEPTIRFSGGSGPAGTWISLRDNGPGIPAEIVGNIFDPFFTTKPVGKGTGLGLYIVKNEVMKSQGTIEIRRPPEGGTEFLLTFPAIAREEAA